AIAPDLVGLNRNRAAILNPSVPACFIQSVANLGANFCFVLWLAAANHRQCVSSAAKAVASVWVLVPCRHRASHSACFFYGGSVLSRLIGVFPPPLCAGGG